MDASTQSEMEARVLAAIIHKPTLAPTAFHHLSGDLWASPHAFQDSRLRRLADAAWDCQQTGRDTSPANLRRMNPELASDCAWLLSTFPGEAQTSLDRLARDLAGAIRVGDLLDILLSGQKTLAGPGEPEDLISKVQAAVCASPGSNLNLVTGTETMDMVLNEYDARKNSASGPIGIPTGMPMIDGVCGGLPLRAVTILGARPSQGKTALASCIALAALHSGHPVIFFSHEMAALDIGQRMACQEQRISFSHVRSGRLAPSGERKLAEAQKWIAKQPLHIIDSGGPSPQDCRNTAMYLLNKYRGQRPPLLIVDYIQLEHIKGWKSPNRYEEITEISSQWIETAKLTGAAVLALAQLNRQADGSQPVMSQLKESGALEQDANMVMLLWRPAKDRPQDKQDDDPDPTNRKKAGVNWAVLSVAKSRNSDLTEQELYWEGYCMRYRPWDPKTDIQMNRKSAQAQEYNSYMADIIAKASAAATNQLPEPTPPPEKMQRKSRNFGE